MTATFPPCDPDFDALFSDIHRWTPMPISSLYLLCPLSIALEQIPPAKHLILCNQQQSSAGTHLITAPEIERLCWERGSGMFCSFSCLVWDKAALLRDLHSSARGQCIRPDKFTYTVGWGAGDGGWVGGGGGDAAVRPINSEAADRGTPLPHRLNDSHGRQTRERSKEGREPVRSRGGSKGALLVLLKRNSPPVQLSPIWDFDWQCRKQYAGLTPKAI